MQQGKEGKKRNLEQRTAGGKVKNGEDERRAYNQGNQIFNL